jgi:hypothetical protein
MTFIDRFIKIEMMVSDFCGVRYDGGEKGRFNFQNLWLKK